MVLIIRCRFVNIGTKLEHKSYPNPNYRVKVRVRFSTADAYETTTNDHYHTNETRKSRNLSSERT
jgi:hypothetical protein